MIDNKTLLAEIVLCKRSNQISDKLGEMIVEIVEKQLSKPNFCNWSNKDDLAAHAYCHLCYCILKFNPSSSNPYAFCVTITTSAFHNFMCGNRKYLDMIEQEVQYQLVEHNLYNEDSFFEYQLEVDIPLKMRFYDWTRHCKGTWKIDKIVGKKYKLMFTHKDDLVFAKMTFG